MNSEYIMSIVIGIVLLLAGAIVIDKGIKIKNLNNKPFVITVGIMIIFFSIAIVTITTLQNLK